MNAYICFVHETQHNSYTLHVILDGDNWQRCSRLSGACYSSRCKAPPLGSCTLTIHSLLGVTVTVYIAAILVVHIGNRPACNSQHQWDEKFVNHCSFISQPWGKIGFTIYSTPMEETYYDVIMS